MKLRLSSTSIARRKCGRIASPARCAVRYANSRYSATSARGIEHFPFAIRRENVLPGARVVALREPRGRVADRVLQRPRAQSRALGLRAIDLHETRLVGERERNPQRQSDPRIDFLLDQDLL